jgi:hypothetical protein
MPMTTARYARIKAQIALWHRVDPEHTDHAALAGMFTECLTVLDEILLLAEEPESPSFRERLARIFRGG